MHATTVDNQAHEAYGVAAIFCGSVVLIVSASISEGDLATGVFGVALGVVFFAMDYCCRALQQLTRTANPR